MSARQDDRHDDRERDEEFMRLAIVASQRAVLNGDMPFGATLVRDRKLLQVSANNQLTMSDCTGHAELVLLRAAASKHGAAALSGATVYASGEPCAMCSGAMFWAGIARVVYAATNPDIIDALGGPFLTLRCADVMRSGDRVVLVEGPLLRDDAVAVLRAFARSSAALVAVPG
jgi:tRNA(Arg) A34 adenosine deaminase TadA